MDYLSLFETAADAVQDAVRPLVGTRAGGENLAMGADGTPTKRIDQVAEDACLRVFREEEFGGVLISEEIGEVRLGDGDDTIFLDPVDGTFNAITGIPFYAISLAFSENDTIREGYVRNLATGETFTAREGQGARCDDDPIRTSGVSLLEECAMSIYGRKFDPATVIHLGRKIRRFRLLGASALELCYVASGRLDGFIDVRGTLRVIDAVAGVLIAREAGGQVTDLEGTAFRFPRTVTMGKSLVATNGMVHGKVVEYLREGALL
ncbi:MAG: bifunctional fructose-bisphosphatase/inositol-phosphate phosphatase [Methanomicrobiales archaeon]